MYPAMRHEKKKHLKLWRRQIKKTPQNFLWIPWHADVTQPLQRRTLVKHHNTHMYFRQEKVCETGPVG